MIAPSTLNAVLEHTDAVSERHYKQSHGEWKEACSSFTAYYNRAPKHASISPLPTSSTVTGGGSHVASSLRGASLSANREQGATASKATIPKAMHKELLQEAAMQVQHGACNSVSWKRLRQTAKWGQYTEEQLKDTHRRAKKQKSYHCTA